MKTSPLFLTGFAMLLAACAEAPRAGTKRQPAAPSPVAVTRVAVAEQQWPSTYEASGTVRAGASVAVASRIAGYVRQINVREGDRVRAGQVLVSLDARDLDVNSGHAAATLQEVRGAMPEADGAEKAAQANLDLAQSTFQRMRDLLEKKSISPQEFDEASARLKSAQAAREIARARRAQLDSQAARVLQDVRAAEVARGFAEIAAPFAGVVTVKSVDPGAMALPGAPLLTIEREGAYRLEAAVEESRLSVLRAGQPVSVTIDGLGQVIDAKISEIVPMVNPTSRTATVKIALPALPGVRSGLFGRANFPLGGRSALAIPAAALQENGQLQSVLVVENGVARTRLVTVGERSKDRLEVLSGLTAGDRVIVPIPPNLTDGGAVEVRP